MKINEKKNSWRIPFQVLIPTFLFENQGTSYVPIYSDIYGETKEIRLQLTATLSIGNTSTAGTLFISKVSYHNTVGITVREYVKEPIFLRPLETLEYVIEQNDTEGGTGANFMIDWSANAKIKPLFQGVMVGIVGQQGFAFTTEYLDTSIGKTLFFSCTKLFFI